MCFKLVYLVSILGLNICSISNKKLTQKSLPDGWEWSLDDILCIDLGCLS